MTPLNTVEKLHSEKNGDIYSTKSGASVVLQQFFGVIKGLYSTASIYRTS